MTEPDQPPSPDRVTDLVSEGAYDAAVACLDRLDTADSTTRKRALQALRDAAADDL